MGPTGCGKSSVRLNVWSSRRFLTFVQLQKFIEKATGTTGMAGHNLQSCTSEVSVIRLEYPGVNLCVVDTPGFDNTNKSDVDILRSVGKWLSTTYVTINNSELSWTNDLRMTVTENSSAWLVCSTSIASQMIVWLDRR